MRLQALKIEVCIDPPKHKEVEVAERVYPLDVSVVGVVPRKEPGKSCTNELAVPVVVRQTVVIARVLGPPGQAQLLKERWKTRRILPRLRYDPWKHDNNKP